MGRIAVVHGVWRAGQDDSCVLLLSIRWSCAVKLQCLFTFRLELELLNLLGTWHELSVYVELTTSSGDQMAILQHQFSQVNRTFGEDPTCDPKSRMRMVSKWSCISAMRSYQEESQGEAGGGGNPRMNPGFC